jgi:hypothetical protein
MLLIQGWKGQEVQAIMLTQNHQGMSGWSLYVGTYTPPKTINEASWVFKCAAHSLRSVLGCEVLNIVAEWTDQQPCMDLKAFLGRIEGHVVEACRVAKAAEVVK